MNVGQQAVDVRAYPTLTEAALMIGVSPSTLSRRKRLKNEQSGGRDRRLRPRVVLSEASHFGRRSLAAVGESLIAYAVENVQEAETAVRNEVSSFLGRAGGAPTIEVEFDVDVDEFLENARRILPADLVASIEEHLAGRDS